MTLARVLAFTTSDELNPDYVNRVPRKLTQTLEQQAQIWERECNEIERVVLRTIAILARDEQRGDLGGGRMGGVGTALGDGVGYAPAGIAAVMVDDASATLSTVAAEEIVAMESTFDSLLSRGPPSLASTTTTSIDASSLLGSVPTLDDSTLLGDNTITSLFDTAVDLTFLHKTSSPGSALTSLDSSEEGGVLSNFEQSQQLVLGEGTNTPKGFDVNRLNEGSSSSADEVMMEVDQSFGGDATAMEELMRTLKNGS